MLFADARASLILAPNNDKNSARSGEGQEMAFYLDFPHFSLRGARRRKIIAK